MKIIVLLVGKQNRPESANFLNAKAWDLRNKLSASPYHVMLFDLNNKTCDLCSLEQAMDAEEFVVFDEDVSSHTMNLISARLIAGKQETIFFAHGTVTTYVTASYKNASRCEEVFVLAQRLLAA